MTLAQQGNGNNTDEDLLPDIDPQDIEIRSDYQPRFPGLRRQPILGFDPRPRVYQMNPNRMPFMETREEVVASVPVSRLKVPGAPLRSTIAYPDPNAFYTRIGLGMYMTPDVSIAFNEYQNSTRFISNLNFLSSNGADQAYNNSFRNADGYLGFTHSDDGRRWTVLAHGLADMNYMPFQADSTLKKSMQGGGISAEIQAVRNTFNITSLSVDYNYSEQDITSLYMNHRIGANFTKTLPGKVQNSKWEFSADAQTSFYEYTAVQSQSDQWLIGSLSMAYQYRTDYSKAFRWGLSAHYSDDAGGSGFMIYPELRFQYWGFSNVEITMGLDGNVTNPGLSGWYEENRFLANAQDYENHRGFRVYTNLTYQLSERNEFYTGFEANRYTNTGVILTQYIPPAPATPETILNGVAYDEAQITRFHVGYALHSEAKKLTLKTELYYQHHITDQLAEMPYLPKYGTDISIIYSYNEKWKNRFWIDASGGREEARASQAYVLAGLDSQYWISDRFSIYVKALNLLNQSYELWSGYEELPLTVLGGITFKF